MKMVKKQCTQCKRDLDISLFNLYRGQLTKCCVKCLDTFKKSRQQTKCEHVRQRSYCKGCGGGEICEQGRQRSKCPTCDPLGHLTGVVQCRVHAALKNDKEMSSIEYLGCNIEALKQNIEQQFTEGMSWENYVEWHIDHKIPLKYNKPSLEEVVQRLHYTNTQPMWASENMSKGCRYISG